MGVYIYIYIYICVCVSRERQVSASVTLAGAVPIAPVILKHASLCSLLSLLALAL